MSRTPRRIAIFAFLGALLAVFTVYSLTNIMSAVKKLAAQRGITVACVLHDLNLAYFYGDTVALLKDGKVYAAGEPKDVMTKSNLENVYDTKINIIQNGDTFILPVME